MLLKYSRLLKAHPLTGYLADFSAQFLLKVIWQSVEMSLLLSMIGIRIGNKGHLMCFIFWGGGLSYLNFT